MEFKTQEIFLQQSIANYIFFRTFLNINPIFCSELHITDVLSNLKTSIVRKTKQNLKKKKRKEKKFKKHLTLALTGVVVV